jgi:hypothetical protein
VHITRDLHVDPNYWGQRANRAAEPAEPTPLDARS